MRSSKRTTRLRTLFLSLVIGISICAFSSWAIRELLFPPTDVCAIEQKEGKKLLDISHVYPIENNTELVGHWGGEAKSVFVRGDLAFLKLGLELAALDIHNPANPRRVGYLLIPGELIYVDEAGNYAYILSSGDSSGLWKVEVSNPAQMSAAHLYQPIDYSYIKGIQLAEEKAYITTQRCEYIHFFEGSIQTRCDETLHIVDTNYPDLPAKCYQGSLGNTVKGFTISSAPELITAPSPARQGNYLYVAEGKDGLKIYDMSNPSDSVEVSSYSPGNRISNLFSFKIYLYATVSEDQGVNKGIRHTLHAFDVANPMDPVDLGELSSKPFMIADSEGYGFLRGYPAPGVEILDMSLPMGEGNFPASEELSNIVNITVVGNRAYAATDNGKFLILDMSDMKHPTVIANRSIGSSQEEIDHISVNGNYAYVMVRNRGMKILDISDETKIVDLGQHKMFDPFVELAIKDNYVYIAQQYGGFEIVDVSRPQQPTKVGEYDLDHQIANMQIVNNHLFMSASRSGLQILDITDPKNPWLAGSFVTGASVWSIDVGCPYIYVSDMENGFFILRSDLLPADHCD